MATVKDFYLGARPKTLGAAIAPVLIGGSLGAREIFNRFSCSNNPLANCISRSEYFSTNFSYSVLIACFVVALALQVGVNYANDYSDGKKGTDDNRVGPMRLVGSGTASARSVLNATLISFLVSGVAGIYIASQSSWWLILVGAVCICLAWFYTGGKYAYGYYGFGELSAFITFGLVATVGTFFAITNSITIVSVIAGCVPGFYSVAILLANNIRDIPSDQESGKRTIATRIGSKNARHLFALSFVLVGLSIVLVSISIPAFLVGMVVLAYAVFLARKMYDATRPPEFISILVGTSKSNLITGVLISSAIVADLVMQ